jgi:hypothetical protein
MRESLSLSTIHTLRGENARIFRGHWTNTGLFLTLGKGSKIRGWEGRDAGDLLPPFMSTTICVFGIACTYLWPTDDNSYVSRDTFTHFSFLKWYRWENISYTVELF